MKGPVTRQEHYWQQHNKTAEAVPNNNAKHLLRKPLMPGL
jgi:hypothetical protein